MPAPNPDPPRLLSLLRDPSDLGELQVEGDSLVNRASRRRYPIVGAIPVFVEADRLGPLNRKYQRMYDWMSCIYDAGQTIGDLLYRGKISQLRRRLSSTLGLKPGHRCLYTSVGTGSDVRFLSEQVPLASIEFVGLDISMGMLRRCRRRLRALGDASLLVQANAERLPFADRTFDVVLHVGGINFFDRPAEAVREMLRVARPGARILVADETKVVVRQSYQRNPLTRAYFRDADTGFNPRSWIPDGAVDPSYEEFWDGRIYFLMFRAAGAA